MTVKQTNRLLFFIQIAVTSLFSTNHSRPFENILLIFHSNCWKQAGLELEAFKLYYEINQEHVDTKI